MSTTADAERSSRGIAPAANRSPPAAAAVAPVAKTHVSMPAVLACSFRVLLTDSARRSASFVATASLDKAVESSPAIAIRYAATVPECSVCRRCDRRSTCSPSRATLLRRSVRVNLPPHSNRKTEATHHRSSSSIMSLAGVLSGSGDSRGRVGRRWSSSLPLRARFASASLSVWQETNAPSSSHAWKHARQLVARCVQPSAERAVTHRASLCSNRG